MCWKNMVVWKKQYKVLQQKINMVNIITEILISEKELTDNNYERLKKVLSYIENNLIDSEMTIFI